MNEYLELLGFKVRDVVTGFSGTVTSVSFDLYGCVQAIVSPEFKDGKIGDSHWFDLKRLKVESADPVMACRRSRNWALQREPTTRRWCR